METIVALQETPVPTILVIAGLLFLFFALGGNLKIGGIPQGREIVFGSIGLFLLIGGVFLFAWSGEVVAQPPLTSTWVPDPTPQLVSPTSMPTKGPTLSATSPTTILPAVENTLVPTPKSTQRPTSTNTPTPTPTFVGETFYQVNLASNQGVNIYTQPSDLTGAPRAQVKGGDIVEKLEQNSDGSWYRVRILKNGIEGWIQVVVLTPTNGTAPTPTPSKESNPTRAPSNCLTVAIERKAIVNREFDTITLRYSNWPAGTVDFAFEVYTIPQGGGIAYLVEPTFTDTGTPFYEMAYARFEQRGFQPLTPFDYIFQPRNAAGEVLCTKAGSFTNP